MGYARMEGATISVPYNPEADLVFFDTTGDPVTIYAGMFAIFTLQDIHMPCLAVDKPESVRKVIVKIAS